MADNAPEYRYLQNADSRSLETEINKLAVEGYEVVSHAMSALTDDYEHTIWHTVVMRRHLPMLTATAGQATAERADLDERLAALEMALDEATFKRGQLAELAARVERLTRGVEAHDKELAAMQEVIGLLHTLTALAKKQHTQHTTQLAVLEDSIGGVSKRQGETYSDVCGLAERIKRLEEEGKSTGTLTVPCDACDGLGTQEWTQMGADGIKEEVTVACDTCHGSGRVPA